MHCFYMEKQKYIDILACIYDDILIGSAYSLPNYHNQLQQFTLKNYLHYEKKHTCKPQLYPEWSCLPLCTFHHTETQERVYMRICPDRNQSKSPEGNTLQQHLVLQGKIAVKSTKGAIQHTLLLPLIRLVYKICIWNSEKYFRKYSIKFIQLMPLFR